MRLRLQIALALSFPVAFLFSSAAAQTPASPEQHFGFRMGTDRKSLLWNEVISYFHRLDRESDRVLTKEYGRSTEGRPMLAAFISSPENLASLERIRETQELLADPRRTPESEAERRIASGKAVVMITCSIHSTEVASTLTAIEFAHRMATDESPKYRNIRENVLLILVPSLNPDGVDLVTGWYRRTLGSPLEGSDPPLLYHKYAGHDNNRDWYMFTQAETRATVSQLHNVWRPQIVYDVHQQGVYASRMFVPPWQDPVDPNIDPLVVQMCNAFGMGMAMDLTAAGRKGVVVNAMYDFWTPARHYQAYRAGVRILSESASARLYSPVTVRPEQVSTRARGYNPRQPSWNYVEPWLGGQWRLRDIVDDQMIAFESILSQAASRREDLLRNYYRIGLRAVGRTTPYAFIIPAVQRDPGAARKLLETLAYGQVEIARASAAFQSGGKEFPAGSYLIFLRQPYGAFAKTLLERQDYPQMLEYPGGPPKRPYDVTAHTLPLLMGVEVETAAAEFPVRVNPASSFEFRPAAPARGAALPAADTESWRQVTAAWRQGRTVCRNPDTGDFLLDHPGPFCRPLPAPRIGVYKSYVPATDEGWTRWVLDQFGFQHAPVTNPEILSGVLSGRYDVIVFPDQSVDSIRSGLTTESTLPEYAGGLGEEGARRLREYLERGGKLVFLNRSATYAVQALGLPFQDVTAGLPERDFFLPGSLLRVRFRPGHPLTLGLPSEGTVWCENGPAWASPPQVGTVVASYPDSGILASGWLLGEAKLAGKAALLEAQLGKGRVTLFGFRPQYRGQSYLTFKIFFNALVQ